MQTLRNEEEESSYEIFNRILALGLLRCTKRIQFRNTVKKEDSLSEICKRKV